jgi:diguanylate cyclase (GGDEF)-like protein
LVSVLAGAQLGHAVRLDDHGVIVGRSPEAGLSLSDPGLSWNHARIWCEGGSVFIEDLGSRNGTFVEGSRLDSPSRLSDGERVRLGGHTILKLALADELEEEAARRLYDSAVRDPLTELYNRRYLEGRLQGELSFAMRNNTTLAVLFLDVDRFKRVNDALGHHVGDALLRVIATTIQRIVRPEDVVARYGGEEFVVLCRGISARNAVILAERIRQHVAAVEVPSGSDGPTTVSIGVAATDPGMAPRSAAELLAAADGAMYRAKELGRNRVVFASS